MTDDQSQKPDTDASADKNSTEEANKEVKVESPTEKTKDAASTAENQDELGTRKLPNSTPLPGTQPSLGGHSLSPDKLRDEQKPSQHETAIHPAAGRMPAIQPARSAADRLLDRKTAYRRWLEARSKDELIELILGLELKEPALEITEKMMKVSTGELSPQSGFVVPPDLTYARLPVLKDGESKDIAHAWKIVLVNLELGNKPIGLIIDSEVTVGRAVGESKPDFDLTPFGGSTRGVSRVHAKFHPTANSFAVIDHKSTNGTYCNKSRIEPEKEHALKDGDIIAFGRVNFLFKVVKSPEQD